MLAFTVPMTHFQVPFEASVVGLITGMAYGLLAIGLTFAYRISRVINFAHGEIGGLCSAVVAVLVIENGWPFWIALLIALALALVVGVAIDFFVMRRLVAAPRLVVMAATIAVGQILFLAATFLPQTGLASHDYPVPFNVSLKLGSLTLHTPEVVTLIAVPLIVGALTVVIQRTYLGLAMRFTSDNLEAAQLAGVPASRISSVAWMIVSFLAASAAILASMGGRAGAAAPGAAQTVGPTLLAVGLGASMLGGLTSFPTVFAGGVVIGVARSLITWNFAQPGLFELVIFGVVLISLLIRKRLGQLARGAVESSWSMTGFLAPLDPARAGHPRVRVARRTLVGAVAAVAIMAPISVGISKQVLLTTVVIFALIGLSSMILTGLAGQISLGQFAFVGVAALVAGRLSFDGYPLWVAAFYGVGSGVLLALAIGLPALRVRGIFLAVVTLAFGVMAATYLPRAGWLVKTAAGVGGASSEVILRSRLWGIDLQDERHFYWMCLALLLLAVGLVHRIKSTGIGRAMTAVRDNEAAAAALAISPRLTKLTAFAISGGLAALGGFLLAALSVNFSLGTSLFDPGESLTVLLMVILGGVTTIGGTMLGAIWIIGLPYLLGPQAGLMTSTVAVLIILLYRPSGLISVFYLLRDRAVRALIGSHEQDAVEVRTSGSASAVGSADPLPRGGSTDADLMRAVMPSSHDGRHGPRRSSPVNDANSPIRAEDITVRFGGVLALDRVSMFARRGEILGLVGPNGAGKTTLFEVLSGAISPVSGRVFFEGTDVTRLRADQRAQAGLGRTFQQAHLFPDMTLRDAFKVALERRERSELFPSLVGLPPSRSAERRKDVLADEILDLLGLTSYGYRSIAELSTGLRRLAEIGCSLALGASVMLLDEPTAGLSQREVEAFVPTLQAIQADMGSTIVIISHDVPMMVELVDRLYVLASGQVIATGDPHLLQSDPRVLEVYMGTSLTGQPTEKIGSQGATKLVALEAGK